VRLFSALSQLYTVSQRGAGAVHLFSKYLQVLSLVLSKSGKCLTLFSKVSLIVYEYIVFPKTRLFSTWFCQCALQYIFCQRAACAPHCFAKDPAVLYIVLVGSGWRNLAAIDSKSSEQSAMSAGQKRKEWRVKSNKGRLYTRALPPAHLLQTYPPPLSFAVFPFPRIGTESLKKTAGSDLPPFQKIL
jgi:hypothetical protein